ncbi:MAG: GIY-YIG nuclease family protein [Rhodospirillales bacterium]|nr:GIY-YIG nuclease family protein [Rhodospirillales bacterium]MCB9995577.1 GIY-YIG nuclease family protein [Rhodospirillales bacterium]
MEKKYYVYILTNQRKNVLYIGFTCDLKERVEQHKAGVIPGFTKRYNVNKLIYYEEYDWVEDAKKREKAMKKWNRMWKEDLIGKSNPGWEELIVM